MAGSLVIAERAYRAIERECLQHPDTETGGVLGGSRLGPYIVVPFTVPAGRRAVRHASAFTPDHEAQQELLDYLCARFPGMGSGFAGDWHRHPGSYDRPSQRDHEVARHIVTAPGWNCIEAVFPIAVIEEGRVRMRAYLMNRFHEDFVELPLEVVPDTDPRMQAVLLPEARGGIRP
jgi:integrative and conjugative element protein (TIGR02256 family)